MAKEPKKQAARTAKPTAAGKKPAKSSGPRVTVRMYLQGLGDCFFLRFEPGDGTRFDALIDCGIYKSSGNADVIMKLVAQDIAETTKNAKYKNGHLDLLVVTHEHWDHISGFAQGIDTFEKIHVSEVWQAWTESPGDPVARELTDRYKKAKTALVNAMRAAATHPAAANNPRLNDAFEVMNFFGVDKDPKKDKKDAYEDIKAMLARKDKLVYLEPGEVRPLGKTGVKAFVLGPPKDTKVIAKDDPGKVDGYHKQKSMFFDGFSAMLGAAEAGLWAEDDDAHEHPFGGRYEIDLDTARGTEYFQSLYDFDDDLDHPENFRRIDDLAFDSLSHLALRLDSHLNNTSLVLAFQLPGGDVLLFPGDAQAGNWKSWAGLEKPLEFKREDLDAHDLLRRTVLYKVSHHGSHNATPRTYGLELMTSDRLRAFVPVDFDIAQQAKYGEMPLVAIMTELQKRKSTVRSDDFPHKAAPTDFTLSTKTLPIETTKEGAFDRPMWVETSFGWES